LYRICTPYSHCQPTECFSAGQSHSTCMPSNVPTMIPTRSTGPDDRTSQKPTDIYDVSASKILNVENIRKGRCHYASYCSLYEVMYACMYVCMYVCTYMHAAWPPSPLVRTQMRIRSICWLGGHGLGNGISAVKHVPTVQL
jgi:hypothetical protein